VAAYLAAIWRYRYFWLSLVQMDLATRYRRSLLGLGWSLLHPIILTVILYTVFQGIFSGDGSAYALEVLAGLVVWNYVSAAASQGCHSFLIAESYIRQCPSPLAIYPLRTALSALVHFGLALLVVLAATAPWRGLPGLPALLALLPALLLLFALGWGLALLAGFANVIFRDTEHLTQVGFQVLFYGTPIIFPAQLLDGYRFGWLLQLNPLVPFLQLFRDPLLRGAAPPWTVYAGAAGWVLVLAVSGALVLRSLQRRLIFYL
jgi:ABC-type polysaccharide/polyol phosphate export permease